MKIQHNMPEVKRLLCLSLVGEGWTFSEKERSFLCFRWYAPCLMHPAGFVVFRNGRTHLHGMRLFFGNACLKKAVRHQLTSHALGHLNP